MRLSATLFVTLAVSAARGGPSQPCPADVEAPPELGDGAMLGAATAIDGSVAVVGAPLDTGAAWASGAVHVYVRESDGWVHVQRLLAGDGAVGDMLGVSVDVHGDTIIAGAWFDDHAGSNSGAAYVFQGDADSGWTQVATLVMPDAAPEDTFGRTVALGDDFCAVGAPLDDDQGSSSGSICVFDREGDTWTFSEKLTHPTGGPGDQLGLSLTVDGHRLLAGAPWAHEGRGEVHLWERMATWTHTWYMTMASAGAPEDYFGFSVALDGDRMAVGSYRDDTWGEDAGSLWMLTRVFDGWAFEHIAPPDPQPGAQFGVSLALQETRVLVGSRFESIEGVASGHARVLDIDSGGWTPLRVSGLEADAEYGWSVAFDDDHALVGALYQPPDGAVYAWTGLVDDCGCIGDLDGDHVVGVNDVLEVLAAWGGPGGDVNDDGTTDVDDVLAIIAAWGPC